MRSKSAAFKNMAAEWAASFGDMSRSMAWISGEVCEALKLKKRAEVWFKSSPLASSASRVF